MEKFYFIHSTSIKYLLSDPSAISKATSTYLRSSTTITCHRVHLHNAIEIAGLVMVCVRKIVT